MLPGSTRWERSESSSLSDLGGGVNQNTGNGAAPACQSAFCGFLPFSQKKDAGSNRGKTPKEDSLTYVIL
jgi:hypothetical protein